MKNVILKSIAVCILSLLTLAPATADTIWVLPLPIPNPSEEVYTITGTTTTMHSGNLGSLIHYTRMYDDINAVITNLPLGHVVLSSRQFGDTSISPAMSPNGIYTGLDMYVSQWEVVIKIPSGISVYLEAPGGDPFPSGPIGPGGDIPNVDPLGGPVGPYFNGYKIK